MKSNFLNYFLTIFVISLMVFASEFFGEREIIFPEIVALSIGCFLTPTLSWNTNYFRMFFFIIACAVLGVLIVLFLPISILAQFIIAFSLGQILLFVSKTGFAPMISAISLPVLIQTKSPIYLISAFSFTLLLILFRLLLEKFNLKQKRDFIPNQINSISIKEFSFGFAFRTILVLIFSFFALKYDFRFMVAPPLLVAFTELTNKNNKIINKKVQATILIILCAFFGAVSRYFLTMKFGLPLTISAVGTSVLLIITLKFFKIYFPPAGAMAILAMLIPENYVIFYPIQVALGIILISICSGILNYNRKK